MLDLLSFLVDLTQGVNAEVIRRITSSESTVKKLIPLLPQFGGPDTTEASVVEETLKSPQFQSALSAFCAAFSTGSLGPLISQFGFQAEAVTAANNGNLEAFINAIQKETTTSPADVVSFLIAIPFLSRCQINPAPPNLTSYAPN